MTSGTPSQADLAQVTGRAPLSDGVELPALLAAMASGGRTLAVAESLTGGSLADAVVSVPGASAVFLGGVVAYATESKARVLGVPRELLEQRGAPDPEVARAMAHGVLRLFSASIAVATTGVAGPNPQDGREPGTVFIAVAWDDVKGRNDEVKSFNFQGSRNEVRAQSVTSALVMLAERMARQ